MLGVFFFGKHIKPAPPAEHEIAAEARLDSHLARLNALSQKDIREVRDTEEMVQAFYDYPANQQVQPDDLKKNPFEMELAEKVEVNDEQVALARTRAQQLQELEKKKATLTLQSVLRRPDGSRCLINGEVFSEGQRLLDTFTIKSIQDKKVILLARDHEFELPL